MIKAHSHICPVLFVLLLLCGTGLSQEVSTASPAPQPFDLDIDSDNNNGFSPPDGSEWEEHIENHAFSIGKLIETGASRWTPVTIRLNTGAFKQTSGNPASLGDLRVKVDFENPSGKLRCWSNREVSTASRTNGLLTMGQEIPLEELNYDATKGTATIWLEAVEAAPGTDTKSAIDQNGRPDMFLRATLLGLPQQEPVTDKVKYLPVNPGTFFPAFVAPGSRPLRNSFPATLVNGSEGLSGTVSPVPPAQSKAYGYRLVTEDELVGLIDNSNLSQGHQRYITDVVYYKTNTSKNPELDGVRGFRIGLYRDYNSGDYTLAFQYSLKDNCASLFQTLKPNFFEYRASEFISHRFTAGLLLLFLADEKYAVKLPGLQLAGAGVGGDLAVFGALGSGVHADTYNTTPFPAEMTKLILTRYDPSQKRRIESVRGSLDRFEHAADFITGHRVTETPYGIEAGPFPIQPAP